MSSHVHVGKLDAEKFHDVVGVAVWEVCVEVEEVVGGLVSGGCACELLVVDEVWWLIGG